MNPPEAVRSPVVIVFPQSIKKRFRDIELVKKELGFFIEQEVPQVKFVDRTFNCSHTHAMEIWRFIKEKDLGKTIFTLKWRQIC